MKTATPTALDSMIEELAKDLTEVVDGIEGSMETTKDHYGRYMSLLAQLGKGNERMTQVIALALIKAGANKQGIASALKLSF